MKSDVLQAYDYLVPADQLVIDCLILSMYKKDIEINKLARAIIEGLDETPKKET